MSTAPIKVAAAHAAPVFLDRETTTKKACELISEAGKNRASLVVFPEVFIPGYPYWIWTLTTRDGVPFFAALFDNAVEVPSKTTDEIGKPHTGGEEKLLYADIDLGQITFAKFAYDSAGHYARPDVFTLQINKKKQNIIEEIVD